MAANEDPPSKQLGAFIRTCEYLRDAIRAKDEARASEAVATLSAQCRMIVTRSQALANKLLPTLELLKSHVHSRHFDEAYGANLALLVLFKKARDVAKRRESH